MQSDKFGRLLKGAINSIAAYECKTAPVIEDELGQQIGLSAASIQRYKAGHIPPELKTIQVLAQAAIRRGYLNRDWLQSFLQAAHYPAPETLVAQLAPIATDPKNTIQPVNRLYHNLPAPSYSQFVRRERAWADVVDGLTQRSSAVIIISLGGMGKTSLAREIAAASLGLLPEAALQPARFEAVVWVSDKDRPGSTTLSSVLDEIARTLDYPGFTQFDPADKQREVEQLVRRQKVLLVLDNFETVADQNLLKWLLRLPEPSKALITTREYHREFQRGGWPVELRGMSEAEAYELIEQRLRQLKLERLVSDPHQFAPLVGATGGNAKAIELALGCLKYGRRSLPQVLAELEAAQGELFEDLFKGSWELLDEAARRVLLAMPLFAAGASGESLAAIAGLNAESFNRAVSRLTDLTLLDLQQADLNRPPRYTLHPLVRAFASARLSEQPELEGELRRRWLDWYSGLAEQVGYCWQDLSRLELLDPEQETIQAAMRWALENKHYRETIRLSREAGYYYYTRGLWEKKPPINLMRAEAAHYLGDRLEEATALAFHLQLLGKQGNPAEVEEFLPRLEQLAAEIELPPDTYFMYRHSLALYWLAQHDFERSQTAWEEMLALKGRLSPHLEIANRQWLGLCLYHQGQLDEARRLWDGALADARLWKYKEGQVAIGLQLAELELDQGQTRQAARRLAEGFIQAEQYQYRNHLAQIHFLYGRLYRVQGNEPAALDALQRAIDLFERLGMRSELAEARVALDRTEPTNTNSEVDHAIYSLAKL